MDGSTKKVFIMRHAERVDFTFGEWIPSSFDEHQNYVRKNLNMPISVPKRAGGPWDFFKDCPLTMIGLYQATLTGEAMRESAVKFSHVFCSPSLRCVETCTNVLKASNQAHLPINIEPGLFEWLWWYRSGMPTWMNNEEFRNCGFNVSQHYEPTIPVRNLDNTSETSEEYYMRSYLVTKRIIDQYPGDCFLIVGHAATLDVCPRQLMGQAPRTGSQIQTLVMKVPYTSVALMEQNLDKTWEFRQPPFPALRHSDNLNFDWKMLL